MFDWTKLDVPGATLVDLDDCPVVVAPGWVSAASALTGGPVTVGPSMCWTTIAKTVSSSDCSRITS